MINATMTDPWPRFIHASFNSAISSDPSGTDKSVFYGPYTRLLYSLLSVDGQFEVVPQYKNPRLLSSQESIDIVGIYVVDIKRHPVLFIEVKPPASLPYDTRREEADVQMRKRFASLRQDLRIPILHGVSAFGTTISFYRYETATRKLHPTMIPSNEQFFDGRCTYGALEC